MNGPGFALVVSVYARTMISLDLQGFPLIRQVVEFDGRSVQMGRTVWFDRWFDQPRNPEALGAVRRKQEKGDSGVIGLRHRREPVGRGRTGGADQCGGLPVRLPSPRAKKAAVRSSRMGMVRRPIWFSHPRTRGGAGTRERIRHDLRQVQTKFWPRRVPMRSWLCG